MAVEEIAVIGKGIRVRGEVSGEEPLTIAGSLEGNLQLVAEVVVAPEGLVKGRVEAPVVIIGGRLEGEIHASDLVRLDPGCRVEGTLSSPRLVIEEGAVLNGTLEMDVGPSEAGVSHE